MYLILLLLIKLASANFTAITITNPALPIADTMIAVAYDKTNDTIILIGGLLEPRHFVTFKDNIFTDYGTNELPSVYNFKAFGQYYSQIGTILYAANSYTGEIVTFDTKRYTFSRPGIYIPPGSAVFSPCVATMDDGINQYIFIVGGSETTSSMFYNTFQLYNITLNTWLDNTNFPVLDSSRRSIACIVHQQRLWAAGGFPYTDIVESIYVGDLPNIDQQQWNVIGHMHATMCCSRMVSYGNDIIIFGGHMTPDNFYTYHNVIDTTTMSVSIRAHSDDATSTVGVIRIGKTIYGFGGAIGDTSVYTEYWQKMDLPDTTSPTMSPTTYPTSNPIICLAHMEGWSALSNNGEEQTVNEILLSLGFNTFVNNGRIYDVSDIAQHAVDILPFKNDGKQQVECINIVSCIKTDISFENNTICNILCGDLLACASANIVIDSCTNVHIICNGDKACDSANITITNASESSIVIECGVQYSCQNMRIDIIGNTTSTNITCIAENACDNIQITVKDHEHTFLYLYENSLDVIFDNGAGFLSYDRKQKYIECNTKYKYIAWDNFMNEVEITTLILNEYVSSIFPCNGVTVKCKTDLSFTESNGSCSMDYLIDSAFSVPNSLPFVCYWISIEDIVESTCFGSCVSSPTEEPTAAPTNTPTKITIIPTNAPTISPSMSPSEFPTIPTDKPTNNPSPAPTNNPTSLSPTQPPTMSPSHSPTIPPSVAPTHSPTYSPTQAPTRNPTSSKYDFDSRIKIIYVLANLNEKNNNFILNNTENHVVEYIEEIIESHYYDATFLTRYEYFTVRIGMINGINYRDDDQWIKENVLYNDFGVFRDEMFLESKIEFNYKYSNYILSTSKDTEWYSATTNTFREYFNNSMVEFYVQNPDKLEVITDQPESSFGFTFWTLNAMLLLCVMIGIAAWLYNNYSSIQHRFPAVDESDWLSIILYGIQIYDIVSDLNLTSEIFIAIENEEAHIPGEDREGIVDSPKEWILFLSGWFSILCIVLPYGLNIWAAVKLPSLIHKIVCARNYFQTYRIIFIFLVIFSGGAYPALSLVSSKLFGLEMLNCGLSRFEMDSLVEIRVVTTVLTENVPQLIVQIMYSYAISDITQNTILAFCTSIASITASVMIYFMNKEQQNDTLPIDYYLEVKKINHQVNHNYNENINGTDIILSEQERENIEMNKGVTYSLAKKMTTIYGDIARANYQIAYVHLRNDNFVIRIVQQLHEQDLNLDKEYDMNMDIENQFSIHCLSEYSKHKSELNSIIFHHYGIDRNLFEIIYHQKYPSKQSQPNVVITQEETTELVQINDNISSYDLLTQYKNDIFKGIDIIKQETNNLPQTYNGVTSLQINRLIQTLSDNKMNHRVIEDVLSVAIKSGALKKQPRRNSDIDVSVHEQSQNYIVMDHETD